MEYGMSVDISEDYLKTMSCWMNEYQKLSRLNENEYLIDHFLSFTLVKYSEYLNLVNT